MMCVCLISTTIMDGQSPYKSGGRRGHGSSRGRGQGNVTNPPPKKGGGPAHFGGKGRGRGKSRGAPRKFPPYGVSSSSHPEPMASVNESGGQAKPSSHDHEADPPAELPFQECGAAKSNDASGQRANQVAWCELCKVDCNTLEILEQHKNGKRHKKSLKKKGLETPEAPSVDFGNGQKLLGDAKLETTLQPENLPTEAVAHEDKVDCEQQNAAAEQKSAASKEHANGHMRESKVFKSKYQSAGKKRKIKDGHGGKHAKTFNGRVRRLVEPRKPKVVIPVVCDLCNIKCDTQEVFDHHLAGKKHIAKLKRFQGHQAMYGPAGLQALYPPNPFTQALHHPRVSQHSFYGPQGSSNPPTGPYMHPDAHHVITPITVPESGFQQISNNVVFSHAIPEFGRSNASTQ